MPSTDGQATVNDCLKDGEQQTFSGRITGKSFSTVSTCELRNAPLADVPVSEANDSNVVLGIFTERSRFSPSQTQQTLALF